MRFCARIKIIFEHAVLSMMKPSSKTWNPKPLSGQSSRCGSESSTLQTDVCVWRYWHS